MLVELSDFFNSSGFMPHGHCFLWTPSLLWIYVAADSLIAVSYYTIPIALWYFVKKREDLPFSWIFVMFGIFVMACGTTHIFSVWNIWQPNYWADAGVKAITAVASVITAVMIWPLIPLALAIPSQEQLKHKNQELQNEVAHRNQAETSLQEINKTLAQRTAQLESVNRELEAFSYSVAHDLRAPLRHIEGYSQFLITEAKNLNDTEIHYLDAIVQSTTKMGKLIDDLLTLSRTGRIGVQSQSVDMHTVVEAARRECLPASVEDSIDWRLGKLPIVYGDASLLQVVFTNLIANAVKFSRGSSHPVIQINSQEGHGDEVIIEVKDNGVGFNPLYQNKLFGVFQRLHREDEFEGTGIGLAIVRRIIERHGGRVWAEGELNQGASFFVALKRA